MLIIPAVILLLTLLAYPLYRMVVVSLQKYEQPQLWGTRPPEWIGLANYQKLLTDPTFWDVGRAHGRSSPSVSVTLVGPARARRRPADAPRLDLGPGGHDGGA